jgi:hypothetical protein
MAPGADLTVQMEFGLPNTRRKTMSLKFAIALVAVIAYASPALTGGRNNCDTSKSAQYCDPQLENSDGPRVYC